MRNEAKQQDARNAAADKVLLEVMNKVLGMRYYATSARIEDRKVVLSYPALPESEWGTMKMFGAGFSPAALSSPGNRKVTVSIPLDNERFKRLANQFILRNVGQVFQHIANFLKGNEAELMPVHFFTEEARQSFEVLRKLEVIDIRTMELTIQALSASSLIQIEATRPSAVGRLAAQGSSADAGRRV